MQSYRRVFANLPFLITRRNLSTISTIPSNKSILFSKYPYTLIKPRTNLKCINYNDIVVRHMAGHSKWQNIKHTKAAKDSERQKLFSKHRNVIRRAIDDGNNINPKLNSKLASAIESAKQDNMPQATIDGILKRAINKKLKISKIELTGPNGCFFILEVESEEPNKVIYEVKSLCRKSGGIARIVEEGRTRTIFDRKGVIKVSKTKDGSPLNSEKALDDAILAGAEEIKETNDEQQTVIEFICCPGDFNKVKKELESGNYIVQEASMEFLAPAKVTLTEDEMSQIGQLLALFEELPDVQKIYDNVQ